MGASWFQLILSHLITLIPKKAKVRFLSTRLVQLEQCWDKNFHKNVDSRLVSSKNPPNPGEQGRCWRGFLSFHDFRVDGSWQWRAECLQKYIYEREWTIAGQHTCKGSGWHWTYQVVLAFNLESLPSKLVLVSTVLLSAMMVFFAMMVLVFKTEIERWGFLCGPKIWTGIISTLFSLRVSVEAKKFQICFK